MPTGAYRTASGVTGALMAHHGQALDADDPQLARDYFERLFQRVDTDSKKIQELRKSLNFPEVARRFRMIEDDTESVAVTYGSERERRAMRQIIERLRRGAPDSRELLRRLQPYLVSVRTRQAEVYKRRGLIVPILESIGEWLGAYDPVRGLSSDDLSTADLVV